MAVFTTPSYVNQQYSLPYLLQRIFKIPRLPKMPTTNIAWILVAALFSPQYTFQYLHHFIRKGTKAVLGFISFFIFKVDVFGSMYLQSYSFLQNTKLITIGKGCEADRMANWKLCKSATVLSAITTGDTPSVCLSMLYFTLSCKQQFEILELLHIGQQITFQAGGNDPPCLLFKPFIARQINWIHRIRVESHGIQGCPTACILILFLKYISFVTVVIR